MRISESEFDKLVREQGLSGRKNGDEWRFLKTALQDWLRSPWIENQIFKEFAGAWKDDPYLDDMLRNYPKTSAKTVLAELSEADLRKLPLISVDAAAAAQFDKLRNQKKLKQIGRRDLLIGFIAHNATLVTRNLKRFRQITNLKVENRAD